MMEVIEDHILYVGEIPVGKIKTEECTKCGLIMETNGTESQFVYP